MKVCFNAYQNINYKHVYTYAIQLKKFSSLFNAGAFALASYNIKDSTSLHYYNYNTNNIFPILKIFKSFDNTSAISTVVDKRRKTLNLVYLFSKIIYKYVIENSALNNKNSSIIVQNGSPSLINDRFYINTNVNFTQFIFRALVIDNNNLNNNSQYQGNVNVFNFSNFYSSLSNIGSNAIAYYNLDNTSNVNYIDTVEVNIYSFLYHKVISLINNSAGALVKVNNDNTTFNNEIYINVNAYNDLKISKYLLNTDAKVTVRYDSNIIFSDSFKTSVNVKSTEILKPEDCIEQIKSGVSKFKLYFKVGEFANILEFPENENIEIINVYNIPQGLKYDTKKIYGRIIFNKEFTIRVYLNNNNVIDIILVPHLSSKYTNF